MKILVTGANGFIGKHLVLQLKQLNHEVFSYDKEMSQELFLSYCSQAEFIYHLAGVNRPLKVKEYLEGNYDFTKYLIETLKNVGNPCPILLSSSTQSTLDNPYGKSKKASEDILLDYGKEGQVKVLIYRLDNVFGKWCRPNYNSVIATFCHNIGRDLPIEIHDINKELNLVYIDDVIDDFLKCLEDTSEGNTLYCGISPVYQYKLVEIVDLLYSMKEGRTKGFIPDLSKDFNRKLYSTFLSYLDDEDFSYPLKMHRDERGSFTEVFHSKEKGQISINISKPGIVKGNHYHNSKHEKFLVVSGSGLIRLRKVSEDKIIQYLVDDKNLVIVDIPAGYTHSIENIGEQDMVTVIWVNESFDKENPDTYYLEV